MKVALFKIAQKVTRIFWLLFSEQICYQEYQKIAQSGHTDWDCQFYPLQCVSLTFQVEFKDSDKTVEDPSVCWRTCKLIYPNTSLALVSKSEPSTTASEAKLICHCALGDAIDETMIGPGLVQNRFIFIRGNNLLNRLRTCSMISGGDPCLVVMGGDSCSEGRGFESQHRILDIFHIDLL